MHVWCACVSITSTQTDTVRSLTTAVALWGMKHNKKSPTVAIGDIRII